MSWRVLTLVFALGAGRVTAQTLNLSHDLVSLGIASQNLTPNDPTLDARPLFQAALQYVQTNPVQTLTVDPGAYYLLTNQQANSVLVFNTLSDITVDLAGSTIYFVGPQVPNGLTVNYCTNLTLTNFRINYIHPPFTAVSLKSVDAVNRILTYSLIPGWPDPASFNGLMSPFGVPVAAENWAAFFRNGSIVPGTTRTLLQGPFNNSTLTIQDPQPWAQSATLSTLQAGDTVFVTARGGGYEVIIWESSGTTLSNVSIYASAEGAVDIFHSDSTVVDGVRIEPAGTALIAAAGDGIHFRTAGQNDSIRNSYVSGTMDDGLVFESPFAATVISQPAPNQLIVSRNSFVRFPNGTLLNLVDPESTLESAGGTITSQTPPDSQAPSSPVTLTFSSSLPSVSPGTILVFGSAAQRGQGSSIQDSTVENTYGGRGIWIGGAQGVTIQRNVLRRTSMGAVAILQETNITGEPGDVGPPSGNVIVTDNVMEADLGPAACGTGMQDCLGAVTVNSVNNPSWAFAPSPGNTDITIRNNYIADSSRSGVWLGEVNGGTVQNNLIIRSNQNPTLGGTFGIQPQFADMIMQDALVPVAIHFSSSVNEIGDTVSATSNITAPVTFTSAGTAIAAGTGFSSVALQTAISGFAWKATSDSSWLTVTSGPLGTGNGTVQFSAAANGTGSVRTGHITVAGETYTVTQTAGASVVCNVTGDVTTTIADLQKIINEALGVAIATDDLNYDGVINVVDIQIVTDALFGLGC